MLNTKLIASIACADMLNLNNEMEVLLQCGIKLIHIDIMDGVFVRNYCFGTKILEYLKKYKDIEVDIHFYAVDPYEKLDILKEACFSKLSFQIEACRNPIQTINKVKEMGKECGIAINPATHENAIYYLYDFIDYILVLNVEPGFPNQRFIESSVEKVSNIRQELNKKKIFKDIYVDGAVNEITIPKLISAGANVFICGSSGIFKKGKSIRENIVILENTIKSNICI